MPNIPLYADREGDEGVFIPGRYNIDDIRQLSGYARDKKILKQLGIFSENENAAAVASCLIVYPLEVVVKPDPDTTIRLQLTEQDRIGQFVNFYKLGIALPTR